MEPEPDSKRATGLQQDIPKQGTSFNDLSDEILVVDIFSRMNQSKDIFSIGQVSNRMTTLMADKLVHINLYRSMKFGDLGAQHYQSLVCSTLVTFLNEPELALYVDEVDLRWDFPEQSKILELPEDKSSNLLGLIFMKTGILEWEDGADFVLALKEGNQEAYVALLLLLLGNLKILYIGITNEDEWVSWALNNSDGSNFFPSRLSSGFGSLQDVKISPNTNGQPIDDEYTLNLYSIDPFFMLPSIDRIEALHVVHYDEYKWEGDYGTSTLKHLSFEGSCIEVDVTEELLKIPMQLTSFSLEDLRCARDEEGEQEVYDEFCKVLARKRIENCHMTCLV